jgi:hypothetical protein
MAEATVAEKKAEVKQEAPAALPNNASTKIDLINAFRSLQGQKLRIKGPENIGSFINEEFQLFVLSRIEELLGDRRAQAEADAPRIAASALTEEDVEILKLVVESTKAKVALNNRASASYDQPVNPNAIVAPPAMRDSSGRLVRPNPNARPMRQPDPVAIHQKVNTAIARSVIQQMQTEYDPDAPGAV